MKHTPTPHWEYEAGQDSARLFKDKIFVGTVGKEYAAFICLAVNHHDELVAALQGCVDLLSAVQANVGVIYPQDSPYHTANTLLAKIEKEATDAH